jgi:mannosyltransferase OCH1-like enzyme
MTSLTPHVELITAPTAGTHEATIPALLHMIWVGDRPMPDYAVANYERWKELMPEWTVRLWKNEDISTEHFPPETVEQIHACVKGAQKADIMRYFIIERYGGFYVDTDVFPHRSLEPLRHLGKYEVICHDNTITWEYVSIGFFGAIPHSPLFQYACELTRTAVINTPDLHVKTGPHLFGKAVFQTSPLTPYGLLSTHCFYVNINIASTHIFCFGTHTYAKEW